MTDGPERARLRSYLSGAKVEATDAAGTNWRSCGQILEETAAALRMGALRVRDGDGKRGGLSGVTAEAVLAAFLPLRRQARGHRRGRRELATLRTGPGRDGHCAPQGRHEGSRR